MEGEVSMEHRIRVTVARQGLDEANGERVLEAFLETHPETGPVVDQNLELGTLSVTFSLDAEDPDDAWRKGERIAVDGFDAARERTGAPTEIIGFEVHQVLEGEPSAAEPATA